MDCTYESVSHAEMVMASGTIQTTIIQYTENALQGSSGVDIRGNNYVIQHGDVLFIHFSARPSASKSVGSVLASFKSGIPTNHITIPNILAVFSGSYVVQLKEGKILVAGGNAIPSGTQLIADFMTILI